MLQLTQKIGYKLNEHKNLEPKIYKLNLYYESKLNITNFNEFYGKTTI